MGFCYKWSFPVQEYHLPCTKISPLEKAKEKGSAYNYESFEEATSSEVASHSLPEAEAKVDTEIVAKTNTEEKLNLNELIHEFFKELMQFKERIIGKPFDEIYIELDGLLEEYETKFEITV